MCGEESREKYDVHHAAAAPALSNVGVYASEKLRLAAFGPQQFWIVSIAQKLDPE
jgi:hypothetical protein